MKNSNYILESIQEIKNVLQKNEYTRERYKNDIEWFENREEKISSNIIRVALMGITSSGKSTMINAILGEKLLPIAIKPSSSIIITCSKSENRKATVYFRDSEPLVLQNEDLNDENIKKYADEGENPNNKLNVTQIDIKSPKFLLDENIHIIDSPGLDACDLEIHEKITMEVLLPTIDICIFLTTVKANSDEINAEKIKLVSEKDKEILLVQNMIDSIEEKIGKNGIVEENKAEILEKHKKRAQNLLRSAHADKNIITYDIAQISALNAFKGIINEDSEMLKKSNISSFISNVQKSVSNVMPKINRYREAAIVKKINSIILTDKKILNGNEDVTLSTGNTEYVSKHDIDVIFNEFKMLRKKILSKIEQLDDIILSIINEIKNINSNNIDNYLNVIQKVNRENSKIGREILKIVKQCEKQKIDLYKKLNLDVRYSYTIPSITYDSVNLIQKHIATKQLVKKDGVMNKGKRLFSNVFDSTWGYEEKVHTEKIIDKDTTIVELQKVCDVNRVKYINVIAEWSKQYTRSINLFYNEITQKEKEFAKKKNINIKDDDIDFVEERLEEIKSKCLNNEANYNMNLIETEVANDLKYFNPIINAEILKPIYNTYKISNYIVEQNYKKVGNYIHNKNNIKGEKEIIDIFWCYDLRTCLSFVSRMKNIYLTQDEIEQIKNKNMYKTKDIIIVYDDNSNTSNLTYDVKKLYGKFYNLYVIFNGIQIGNSQKQITSNTILSDFFENSEFIINMVIDSSKEFFHGNNIYELLVEVGILKEKLKDMVKEKIVGYILINSRNPIYNIALIECQEKAVFKLSDYKELKELLFKNILCRGEEAKKYIGDILRYFLDYNNDDKDNK